MTRTSRSVPGPGDPDDGSALPGVPVAWVPLAAAAPAASAGPGPGAEQADTPRNTTAESKVPGSNLLVNNALAGRAVPA